MTQTPATTNTDDTNVDQKLDDLERFIARRFDEISMEIEATSQLMEMAEEDAGKRFHDMLSMLHSISAVGDGSSPANSGVELKAVVSETEKAATTIMDAADRIKKILEDHDDDFSSDMRLAALSESILDDVQKIIIACEFQDLVSQRITTSLENIKSIQDRLGNTLEKFGIQLPDANQFDKEANAKPIDTSSQDDIDALFD